MLVITPSLRKNLHIPMLNSLFPSLTASAPHEMNDPACPALKSVIFVDNTGLGADKFNLMLENEQLSGRDFRSLLEWEGVGVKAEKLDRHEVVNLQFTSYVTPVLSFPFFLL